MTLKSMSHRRNAAEARLFLFRGWAPRPGPADHVLKALSRCKWPDFGLLLTVRLIVLHARATLRRICQVCSCLEGRKHKCRAACSGTERAPASADHRSHRQCCSLVAISCATVKHCHRV